MYTHTETLMSENARAFVSHGRNVQYWKAQDFRCPRAWISPAHNLKACAVPLRRRFILRARAGFPIINCHYNYCSYKRLKKRQFADTFLDTRARSQCDRHIFSYSEYRFIYRYRLKETKWPSCRWAKGFPQEK